MSQPILVHISFTLPPLNTVCDLSSLGRLPSLTSPPYDSPACREAVFADEEPDDLLDDCFLVLVRNDNNISTISHGECINLAMKYNLISFGTRAAVV